VSVREQVSMASQQWRSPLPLPSEGGELYMLGSKLGTALPPASRLQSPACSFSLFPQPVPWHLKKKTRTGMVGYCTNVGHGYNGCMTTATALHQLFDSVGNCLSLDAATKLRELRVSDELQSQLDTWATENSEGVLSEEDRKQYEAILRALNFVAVLQAKAKRIADESSNP
ncbi:MAG: hypothetical protein ABL921_35950, partial [Pirellula sp.]